MRRTHLIVTALVLTAGNFTYNPADTVEPTGEAASDNLGLSLPDGFRIEVWSSEVPGARSLASAPDGTIFVGTRREGNVYAVRDTDGDGTADRVWTIASGLRSPNGVAWRDGDLYVAEISRILRFPSVLDDLESVAQLEVVFDDYPTDRHHGWKYIAFGPDGKLYVPVGAPCNICESDSIYATITRLDPDGSNMEIYASGVRNTVGFAWHPETDELWFTDNGRDMMGDDIPPDELNHASRGGMHFGYPYCHGTDIADPEFGAKRPCSEFTAPAQNLGPHVAALGMLFYTGEMFPSEYRNRILIAEHGSWNRSTPIGYRVMMVELRGNEAVSYEPFATGWLQGDETSGRPVDLLQLDDGSILLSDDAGGRIYRITYS
ncbi:MAG: sorbosone dehydrogenase family protein [Acidobacteria bacterium]|nr:sorbosone dehydrogenase family protein [Acidobacteriota bacterium]